MRDLNFRKKRRKQALKRRKQVQRQELKFDTGKSALHFQKEKKPHSEKDVKEILNWTVQIVIVCMIAFVLVFYFGQRVSNAGDSMRPVLKNGDIVLVNRLVYNASRPKRGDIIAFKPNGNENMHYYIKRIVGLPGETVQIKDGKVYIDGKEQQEDIYVSDIVKPGIADEEIELGGDEYFVLGDNTSSSDDSRMADIGNVKRSEIYGKIWFDLSVGNFGFVK